MNQSNTNGLLAVVITYQPNLEHLEQLLNALASQVESILIVDNGSFEDLKAWINNRHGSVIKLLELSDNQGIAAAQNIGIQWALDREAEFVLLMDQDSEPWLDMVEKLSIGLAEGNKQFNNSVIAAGPISFDSRTGSESFFVTEQNGIPKRNPRI